MSNRSYLYDALSLALTLGSFFFFFQSTQFLVAKDYIAASLSVVIGIFVLKIGVELAKIAVLSRRQERDAQRKRSS